MSEALPLRLVKNDLTTLLLCLLHTGSEETHQLPLFNYRQLTTRKHISSAARNLRDRQATERWVKDRHITD